MARHSIKVAELMVSLNLKKLQNGDYLATSKTINGLVAQGRTIAETIEIAQDVAKKLIESYIEHGDPLPLSIRNQLVKKNRISALQIPVAVNF